jgi:HD-GYP domain-containing protein (c-di-GMP phosphodiesterase class II)
MAYLASNPPTAAVVARCLDTGNYLCTHTGNVFYLSMLLGSAVLDYLISERRKHAGAEVVKSRSTTDLTPLGLGAMVMDLGLLPHQDLLASGRQLNEDESDALRIHPLAGAQILPETFSPLARTIVRTHHENMTGTGYPSQLPAEKVHPFARIIRITDAFSAATSADGAYKGVKSPARALWEMAVGPFKRFYDRTLMSRFAQLIQPFPIGAKLRLEDGRYAAVVKYNRRNPFLPTVVVAFDAEDRPLPPEKLEKPVNLATRPDLRIASFRGEDLSYIYSQEPDEPSPTGHFGTPLNTVYP